MQIAIGVIIELFSLIPSLLLVQSFQRLTPRRPKSSSLRRVLCQLNPRGTFAKAGGKNENTKKKKGSKWTFPWWWIFVVYGLCFILAALSIFFIIARGIEFGDLKTQKWLTSILTGFFSSILVIQPIKVSFDLSHRFHFSLFILSKVFSLVIFCACLARNPDDDDQEAGEHLHMEEFRFSNNDQEVGFSFSSIFE